MKTFNTFLFAAILACATSCALTDRGTDGGLSPLEAGGEAAAKVLSERSLELFTPGGWITVLLSAASAAGGAIVARHQTIKGLAKKGS